jgi:murein DD-endopeptidase MepM/ murein hydrolase activator NlpD
VSYAIARHRKPPRFAATHARATSRHRKPPARSRKPALIVAVAATIVFGGAAATAAMGYRPGQASAAGSGQAKLSSTTALGSTASRNHVSSITAGLEMNKLLWEEYAARAVDNSRAPGPLAQAPAVTSVPKHHRSRPKPAAPVYLNPLRAVAGLILERIDMGADFGGSGPIYALGDGIVTSATASSAGWPGGGWITYRLTDGPATGLVVYVAEDVQPTVQVGQTVTSSTVIATMFNGGAGIETGWAMPDSTSAESQLPVAGAISGQGPFPTRVGVNFDALLQSLGVPAAPNASQSPYGLLPSNYPPSWSGLTA